MTDSFERQLDECIELLRGGKSIAEALASCPEQSDRLGPLLEIARALQLLPQPVSSAEGMMRTFIKVSLMRVEAAKADLSKVRFFSRGFLVRAAAVLLVVFMGGWATVNASADSVPGDWLYPVKRFTERAQFFLTVNQEDKAELRIIFSSERLKEAVKRHQRTGRIDQALLDEMLRQARLAAETSVTLPGVSHTLLAGQAAQLSQYQQQMLRGMGATAPPQQQETLARYANMCGRRAQWMRQMCGWGGPRQSSRPRSLSTTRKQENQNRGTWRDRCPMMRR